MMKLTIAPAIIPLSSGSVNKNFHYASRGGALVQITPKFSGVVSVYYYHYYYYSPPIIIILYQRSKSKSRKSQGIVSN